MHINAHQTIGGKGAKDDGDSFCSGAIDSGHLGLLDH